VIGLTRMSQNVGKCPVDFCSSPSAFLVGVAAGVSKTGEYEPVPDP